MKIHEYQGKAILKEYGVPVPRGIVARTPEEAEAAAQLVQDHGLATFCRALFNASEFLYLE